MYLHILLPDHIEYIADLHIFQQAKLSIDGIIRLQANNNEIYKTDQYIYQEEINNVSHNTTNNKKKQEEK